MTRNQTTTRRLGAAAFMVLALSAAAPALADLTQSRATVEAAKGRGEVGEQGDGYLGIVGGGDAGLRAAIAEINAGRADAYKEAAAKTGATAQAAGQATARQLIARLPSGQYYKPLDGGWMRK